MGKMRLVVTAFFEILVTIVLDSVLKRNVPNASRVCGLKIGKTDSRHTVTGSHHKNKTQKSVWKGESYWY
jgi:hypothetical protein